MAAWLPGRAVTDAKRMALLRMLQASAGSQHCSQPALRGSAGEQEPATDRVPVTLAVTNYRHHATLLCAGWTRCDGSHWLLRGRLGWPHMDFIEVSCFPG